MKISGKELLNRFVTFLDENDYEYSIINDTALVYLITIGDVLFTISAEFFDKHKTVLIKTSLPVTFNEDSVIDGLMCVTAANYGLRQGKFYIKKNREVGYEIGVLYMDYEMTKAGFGNLINDVNMVIDRYYSKLLGVANSEMSVEQFIEEA